MPTYRAFNGHMMTNEEGRSSAYAEHADTCPCLGPDGDGGSDWAGVKEWEGE